ncbi:MAG: GDSL-type esterase/lipase family protein [bacterium]
MRSITRGTSFVGRGRPAPWVVAALAVLAGCGSSGGGGSAGPGHVPVYLAGDVRFATIEDDGHVATTGHGAQLGPLALALAFGASPDATIAYDAGALPPLPDPFSIVRGPTKGSFDLVIAPEEVFDLVYNAGEEQIFVTTRGGMHVLVDARALLGAPTVEGNLVHFATSERGKFAAVVDRVAIFDGQELLNYQPISDFSIDADGDRVATPLDCNDSDPSISPLATEIGADGVDENCDGFDIPDEDGDRFPSAAFPGGTDCNDGDPSINPNAEEILSDGIDNDCDGIQANDDDGDSFLHFVGGSDPGPDCNDSDASIFPGAVEVFGQPVDHNCNGVVPGSRITGVGDSITAGVGDPLYDSRPDEAGYLPRLADRLGISRDDVFNRGRPSTESGDGVDKIDTDVSATHPDVVIIQWGANDSLNGTTVHDFAENIKFIVRRVQAAGAKAIVGNVTHVCCGRFGPPEDVRNALIDEYDAALVSVAQDTGCALVDIEDVFEVTPGGLPYVLYDGLHPNAIGYDLMAAQYANVITTQLY